MRIKSIISLIAFLTAFIFSVALIGLPKDNFYPSFKTANRNTETSRRIRDFLEQDKANGRARDMNYLANSDDASSAERLANYASQTELYVADARSLDDSNLPTDFQLAWHAHLDAWQKHSDFLSQAESLDSTDTNYSDDSTFNFNESDARVFTQQGNEINRTWYNVLRIGRKYGAFVSVE